MIDFFNSNPTLPNGSTVPLSGAARAGGFVFLSGQLGLDENWRLVDGDIRLQTAQALLNIETQLSAVGARLDQIVKTTVWLARKEDFAGFNAAYAHAFGQRPPTRSTVVSELLIPGALVEIEALAWVG